MDALHTWRESALEDKRPLLSSRPASPQPLSEDESVKSDGDEPSNRRIKRISTDTPSATAKVGKDAAAARNPTSSSWVRWWSRSRRAETTRPDLGHTNSEPSAPAVCLLSCTSLEYSPLQQVQPTVGPLDGASLHRTPTSASAPPIPVLAPNDPSSVALDTAQPDEHKRFAKTLRLTSDQLVRFKNVSILYYRLGSHASALSEIVESQDRCQFRHFLVIRYRRRGLYRQAIRVGLHRSSGRV